MGRRLIARNSWRLATSRPWLLGEFRWTGFDYMGEAAWAGTDSLARAFNFGVIDLADFPKDLYYFYQSIWTNSPMVHLLPDWTQPGLEGKTIPVVAYANAEEVELFQDGKSLGRKKRSDLFEFVWQVPYHPGELKAIAYRGGKAVAETTERTAGTPAKLKVTTDNAALEPDRTDLALVTVAITDARGTLATNASPKINISLLGPARFLGGENGDIVDITPQRETNRKAFAGLTRAFYAGKDGANGPIEVGALGILGSPYFDATADVTIAFERVALRGPLAALPVEIHYTTDGSSPTMASPRYLEPFSLQQTATVSAAAFRDGKTIAQTTEVFTKGARPAVSPSGSPSGDQGDAEDPTQVKKGKRAKGKSEKNKGGPKPEAVP